MREGILKGQESGLHSQGRGRLERGTGSQECSYWGLEYMVGELGSKMEGGCSQAFRQIRYYLPRFIDEDPKAQTRFQRLVQRG